MDAKCVAVNGAAIVIGAYAAYRLSPSQKPIAAVAGAAGGFALASFILGCKPWDTGAGVQRTALPAAPPVPAIPGGEPTTPPILGKQSISVMPSTQPQQVMPLTVAAKPLTVSPLIPLTYNNISVAAQSPQQPVLSRIAANLKAVFATAKGDRQLVDIQRTAAAPSGQRQIVQIQRAQAESKGEKQIVQMQRDENATAKQAIEQRRVACREDCLKRFGLSSPQGWVCESECDKAAAAALQALAGPAKTVVKDPACMQSCKDRNVNDPISIFHCQGGCPMVEVTGAAALWARLKTTISATANLPSVPSASAAVPSIARALPTSAATTPVASAAPKPAITTTSSAVVPPSSSGTFRLVASSSSAPSLPAAQASQQIPGPMMGW